MSLCRTGNRFFCFLISVQLVDNRECLATVRREQFDGICTALCRSVRCGAVRCGAVEWSALCCALLGDHEWRHVMHKHKRRNDVQRKKSIMTHGAVLVSVSTIQSELRSFTPLTTAARSLSLCLMTEATGIILSLSLCISLSLSYTHTHTSTLRLTVLKQELQAPPSRRQAFRSTVPRNPPVQSIGKRILLCLCLYLCPCLAASAPSAFSFCSRCFAAIASCSPPLTPSC